LWSADYKGQFKTGDGRYCYPLTVADGFSRYLLGCQGLHSTAVAEAKPVFTRCPPTFLLPMSPAAHHAPRGRRRSNG
jgi:transposase InsO family protein